MEAQGCKFAVGFFMQVIQFHAVAQLRIGSNDECRSVPVNTTDKNGLSN